MEKGFQKRKNEPTLYVKREGMVDILIVALYMDDLVFIGNNLKLIEDFRKEMRMRYEMNSLGLLHHFLGIEIHQEDDRVFISQKKYVEKILKKFEMFDCNPTDTPLVMNEKLKK